VGLDPHVSDSTAEGNTAEDPHGYGWAFGLPEIFGSGSSGFRNFGFPKMIPEISWEKEEPENSGTRKFGFGFGFYPNYPKFWNSTYAV